MENDNIKNLREAIKLSPENIPLRLHLADTLIETEVYEEAEKEYKHILMLEADSEKAKYGLSRAYYHQKKYSPAIVILEELTARVAPDPNVLLLYSKSLYKENSIAEAIIQYKRVLDISPLMTDDELERNLKIHNTAHSGTDDGASGVDDLENMLFEKPEINFDHVGGMEKVKDEINIKIIQPLLHEELYKAYGKKVGGGILLYGPPGCGKTHIARATAGQVNTKFIALGLNDILDQYIGNSEKNLHEIFQEARKHSPCILFIDEVDALGASRSDMRQSAGRSLINQFLSEMDGINDSNEGVLILGATNAPWHLDAAFRRPGRFDRIVFVHPPDTESRKSILKILLDKKPIENIDYQSLASKSKDFSGADLRALIDVTIEEKLRESFKSGSPEPIKTNDLLKAMKNVRPSTLEWFTTARNYALYANETGLYDEILNYLNIRK